MYLKGKEVVQILPSLSLKFFLNFIFKNLFIWLQLALAVACGVFCLHCSMWYLLLFSCGIGLLVVAYGF